MVMIPKRNKFVCHFYQVATTSLPYISQLHQALSHFTTLSTWNPISQKLASYQKPVLGLSSNVFSTQRLLLTTLSKVVHH